MWGWWLDSGHEDGLFQGKHGTGHRVKYRVDYFLDNFFGPFFFWTKGEGKHTVSAEGGVGGRVLLLMEEWEVSIVQTILIGFSTDFLYVKILALDQ